MSAAPDNAPLGRGGSYAKGIARRQEILDRAIEVFRERGAQGTSLRAIAEAIGVSHAALLHYFDSREQLLLAVYQHTERPGDADERSADESAADMVVRAAMANVHVPGHVQLYSTLLAASLEADRPTSREYFATRFDRLREQLTTRFRDEQRAGAIRADVDPAHLAALSIAASDGLQVQWLLEPSIQLQQTLETLATLMRSRTAPIRE